MRARIYDPKVARWHSLDPIGFVDGPNLYLYVLGNPVNLLDASGFQVVVEEGDGLTEEEFLALDCNCDETKAVSNLSLYVKVKDSELTINVERKEIKDENTVIIRKMPLKDSGGSSITVIVVRETWQVGCCNSKDKKSSRSIGKRQTGKSIDIALSFSVPKAFGPTKANMKHLVDHVFSPMPMWHYGAAKDNLLKQCLIDTGWTGFWPNPIEKDAKIEGIDIKE